MLWSYIKMFYLFALAMNKLSRINTMVMIHLRFVWSGKSEYLRKLSADWEREAQMRIDSIELRIVNFLSLKHKETKFISLSWLWWRRWLKVFWLPNYDHRLIVLVIEFIEWPGRGSSFWKCVVSIWELPK